MTDASITGRGPFDPRIGPVTVIDHQWIAMPDGVRLAARMWLPETAEQVPVPAILETIPYRKADMVRARDERNHPYFAARGYACLRVDMRGSGDSEGRMEDMYDDLELADARHVIEWIAAQPWCDGNVGMFGTSWGGTASLQANIDAPEPLKAIIAVCATHDRYEDDIHHMGGCLLTDTFEWGATLPAILAAPPTPNVGPDWMTLWKQRLDALCFPVEAWVREEARGAYWRHGSVIHQAERLSRPILAIGGWSDRYSNSVMSLVAARPDLVWGVVGPWGHHYPDHGHPGPAIGFQQLALEWWDRWLKPGTQTPDWPRLRIWLREFDPPADSLDRRRGRWMQTGTPQECTKLQTVHLGEGTLSLSDGHAGGGWTIPSDLRVGQRAGDTGYFGRYGGLPLDQRDDDALSLTFDTAPLDDDVVLYGVARAGLLIRAGSPLRQLSLRLNDVAPDGASARVALCVRNLALDEQLDVSSETEGTAERDVAIAFHSMAYRFRKGHRIRLSVASSYWPMVWPSPSMGDVGLVAGRVILPVFQGAPEDLEPALPPAMDLPERKTHTTTTGASLVRFATEDRTGDMVAGWRQPYVEVHYEDTGTAFGYETKAEHRINPGDPNSACSLFDHRTRYGRSDGVAEIRSELSVTCAHDVLVLRGHLSVEWDGEGLADHRWEKRVPRRYG